MMVRFEDSDPDAAGGVSGGGGLLGGVFGGGVDDGGVSGPFPC